jgi:hypothetical protein
MSNNIHIYIENNARNHELKFQTKYFFLMEKSCNNFFRMKKWVEVTFYCNKNWVFKLYFGFNQHVQQLIYDLQY